MYLLAKLTQLDIMLPSAASLVIHITCIYMYIHNNNNRVEPLNNGHSGTNHFVHYRDMSSFGSKMYCHYYSLVHWKVSFIRGSTVLGL